MEQKFSLEDLKSKNKQEIMEIAKSLGITRYTGKKEKTKPELIDDILSYNNEETGTADSEIAAEVSEEKAETKKAVVIVDNSEQMSLERMEKKKAYIDNAEVGTLVAFKLPNNKVKSAMIVRRSTKNRKFKVETSYGAEFIISFDDVLWVRTSKRWPRGVYELLKGVTNGIQS